MRFIYKDKFKIGHWLFQIIGGFVRLFAIVLKILTLHLIRFDFELNWTMFALKNSWKLDDWFEKIFNKQ